MNSGFPYESRAVRSFKNTKKREPLLSHHTGTYLRLSQPLVLCGHLHRYTMGSTCRVPQKGRKKFRSIMYGAGRPPCGLAARTYEPTSWGVVTRNSNIPPLRRRSDTRTYVCRYVTGGFPAVTGGLREVRRLGIWLNRRGVDRSVYRASEHFHGWQKSVSVARGACRRKRHFVRLTASHEPHIRDVILESLIVTHVLRVIVSVQYICRTMIDRFRIEDRNM